MRRIRQRTLLLSLTGLGLVGVGVGAVAIPYSLREVTAPAALTRETSWSEEIGRAHV